MNIYYSFCENTNLSKAQYAKYLSQKANELLRYVMLLECDMDIDSLKRVYGAHGKPYFKEIDRCFNLSHTDTMVVCATGESEIGVDCQRITKVNINTVKKVFTDYECKAFLLSCEPEAFFASTWSFKEAFVKFLGTGIRYKLDSFSLEGEKSVFALYENLKVVQKKIENVYITAIENGAKKIKIENVDLLS